MEKILHPAQTRGKADFKWLNANYSFSFANYFNPERIQFGMLRVLNDDKVKAGKGFGTHPHQNMEIITIPLKGALTHKDSMDHQETIYSGEVQVMSAGTGVEHSEFNASSTEDLNLLQLWIFPEKNGVEPRYDQRDFKDLLKSNAFTTVVSPFGKSIEKSLEIHQNAYLHIGDFEENENIKYTVKDKNNGVYIFLIDGEMNIDGEKLSSRDALGVWNTSEFTGKTSKRSRILLIEVPMN